MKECKDCVFRKLNCGGTESYFILEVLVRIRPPIGTYCALFDLSRVEAYRQLLEHLDGPLDLLPGSMRRSRKEINVSAWTPDEDPSVEE
jgi:hypothetical protein